MTIRALVVDDTVIFRKIISDALRNIPDVEVVGTANNGKIALDRIESLKPDIVTLDIEMPVMDGIQVLDEIQTRGIEAGVIVLSAFTRKGSELTLRALELGAFDFLTKPSGGSIESNMEAVSQSLEPLIKAYMQRREIRDILKTAREPISKVGKKPAEVAPPKPAPPRPASRELAGKPEFIVLGISTGGPVALAGLLPGINPNLGVPLFIVQHMPPIFTNSLAESLNTKCEIKVKEAEHGETSLPNVAYIAPGGKQMKLKKNGSTPVIHITDDPPENNCKPSIDYLFRSAAFEFPGKSCAVIMTGMGQDGTRGLRLIKRHPALVIAQDEASCIVFGMPKEAIAAGVVDKIVPLGLIAEEINKAMKGF